jgi:hypothetical protein
VPFDQLDRGLEQIDQRPVQRVGRREIRQQRGEKDDRSEPLHEVPVPRPAVVGFDAIRRAVPHAALGREEGWCAREDSNL